MGFFIFKKFLGFLIFSQKFYITTMKRNFLLSNKNSNKIEINISNRNFFLNTILRENKTMSKLLYLDATKIPAVSPEDLGTHHQFENHYFDLGLTSESTIIEIQTRLSSILEREITRGRFYHAYSTFDEVLEDNNYEIDYYIFGGVVVLPQDYFDAMPSRYFEFANQRIEV
jgi:hypothetical protein